MSWLLAVIGAVCYPLLMNLLHNFDGDRDICHGRLSLAGRRFRNCAVIVITAICVSLSLYLYTVLPGISDQISVGFMFKRSGSPPVSDFSDEMFGFISLLIGTIVCLGLSWLADQIGESALGEARIM